MGKARRSQGTRACTCVLLFVSCLHGVMAYSSYPTPSYPTTAPSSSSYWEGSSYTPSPSKAPSKAPTESPTESPTPTPTETPTLHPTAYPTDYPTSNPTAYPTPAPTPTPTTTPTPAPTPLPTPAPTAAPTTAFQKQFQEKFGSVDMASLNDAGRVSKFEEMKSSVTSQSSNITSTELMDTLGALTTLAEASTGMSADTAVSVVETLAESLDTSTIQSALTGKTTSEKKDTMKLVSEKAEAALLAVTKNVIGALTADGAASEFTSSSGIKLKVAKKASSSLPSATESISSTSGKTATFTMPANLPAALTGLTNVGLQVAASTKTFEDPDAVYEPKSDAFSLTFTNDAGEPITGLTFTDPINFTMTLRADVLNPTCFFWDTTIGDWSTSGVDTVSSTSTELSCATYHLSEFMGGEVITAAPTPAPTASPTPSPTPAPTNPTFSPTATPTPAPTATPTPAPSPAPTAAPTPAPTGNPTPAAPDGGVGTRYPTPTPRGMYSSPGPEPTPSPPAPTSTPTAAPTEEVPYSHSTTFASNTLCANALTTKWLDFSLKTNCCNRGSGVQFCGDGVPA